MYTCAFLPLSARPSFLQHRLLVISLMVLHATQWVTDINSVVYYSNSFFVGVIDNPLVNTTLVGASNVVATYVARAYGLDRPRAANAVER